MKTPAVVFAEPGRVEIREMAVREPGPGEVGVRTAFSGVSQGTERWALTGKYDQFARDVAACYPCSPGYQASGVVDAVGPGVTDLREGDRVFLAGTRFLDPSHRYPGPCMASHSGYLVAARSAVTPVAPETDLAAAALYHMAGVVQAAAKHSADRAVDASSQRLEDVVRAEVPDGADVVIDTTGDHRIFSRCVGLIRREGRIAMQGYYPDPITIDFHPTHLQRPTVTFPCGWDDEDNAHLADDLASGAVAIAPLITHRIPFEEAKSAYELVLEHPEASLGMVISWSATENGAPHPTASQGRD